MNKQHIATNRYIIITRWVVGILFIFSGLIKANDPLGLSYKMEEFFEAWGMAWLNDYTLAFSILMNIFEVLAGVAVIIGWRMRLFSWLLLLLILFFCFLTAYAYLSGKIRTCGCFGDCIPLTPLTSFIKDLFLLALILVLFVHRRNITTSLVAPAPQLLLVASLVSTYFFQSYVLKHLPIMDCLPFSTGSNILQNMQVPPGAVPDSMVLTFKYRKNGQELEFDANSFPADFDSTYEFIGRYDKVVKKGSATPAIVDFALQTLDGNDTTEAILKQGNEYLLFMVKDFSTVETWRTPAFDTLLNTMHRKHLPFYLVTADKAMALQLLGNDPRITILICDATAIKTAARVNPTCLFMQVATVKAKFSAADMEDILAYAGALQDNPYFDPTDSLFQ